MSRPEPLQRTNPDESCPEFTWLGQPLSTLSEVHIANIIRQSILRNNNQTVAAMCRELLYRNPLEV